MITIADLIKLPYAQRVMVKRGGESEAADRVW